MPQWREIDEDTLINLHKMVCVSKGDMGESYGPRARFTIDWQDEDGNEFIEHCESFSHQQEVFEELSDFLTK